MLCGVLIAVLGIISHGTTYGSGYAEARALLENDTAVSIWYPLQRALATWLAYVSGVPGGIFSPSLAAGAGLGADLVRFIDFPPPAAVILLTMSTAEARWSKGRLRTVRTLC